MRFSVIIPLYNKAPYVEKTLRSVMGQTFRDFELIVVDDGSTDDSLDVAKTVLLASSLNYRVIHQDNAGVSTARNNGVGFSTGEYLCFLDADDWWEPTFLERMDQFIRDYPDAGLYGANYHYVKSGRSRTGVTKAETGYIDYCRVYVDNVGMPIFIGAVALSRTSFEELGGFKPFLKLGEDFDLWIRIALKYKVAFLNELLTYYNQDADPAFRGTKRLIPPANHILWNMEYLTEEERDNPDFKQLIDNLRTYGLQAYYLSKRYKKDAQDEINKVLWEKQSASIQKFYKSPVLFLRFGSALMRFGSGVKRWSLRLRQC